ncbi:MAG: polysaccharide biosynthesis protein, partial [Thermodesulfobacteriota bacterium]|nr:polysaccharide biosynthesis protein [Thermodesulfobacteriota bacterium]
MDPDRAQISNGNNRQKIEAHLAVPVGFLLRYRNLVKFALHLGIFLFAYLFAFLLRFEFAVPPTYRALIRETILVLILSKAFGFIAFGLFQGWWRYVSIRDILPIIAGCTAGTAIFAGTNILLMGNLAVPRSIYLLDWGITLILVLAARYFIRVGRETFGRRRFESTRRVLIVGAGAAGQMIAREIWENPFLGMAPVGFVDDDPAKIGSRIQGIRVLGDHEKIEEICRVHEVEEIIIAIPSAPGIKVRHIVDHCREGKAKFRILPGVGELIDGKVSVKELREIRIEDLLGREPVRLDL